MDLTNRLAELQIDGFKLNYSERDGVSLTSLETGREYDLLEGMCYCGKASSDIIFIMAVEEDGGYGDLVDYQYGAGWLDRTLEGAAECIKDYENKHNFSKKGLQTQKNVI